MGTKMAVALPVIFMAHIEKQLLALSLHKPLVWRIFIHDMLWTLPKAEINNLIDFANSVHTTIKFTHEMSSEKIVFLNREGPRFISDKILYVQTHLKPRETFQYTQLSPCHPLSIKKGFVNGEALLVEHWAVGREFDSSRTNTQGLKVTEWKVLPL